VSSAAMLSSLQHSVQPAQERPGGAAGDGWSGTGAP
jgi:hypothetical protein